MDARAAWWQRLFPWLFKSKSEPVVTKESEPEKTGQFYYEVWFDGSDGESKWYYAIYDPDGKKLASDWHFGERYTHQIAKNRVKSYKQAAANIAAGKGDPQRFYA